MCQNKANKIKEIDEQNVFIQKKKDLETYDIFDA